MFPVEYIFHEWYQWLEMSEMRRLKKNTMMTGSTLEGFSLPAKLCRMKNLEVTPDSKDLWDADLDSIAIVPHTFQSRITGLGYPIFTVKHSLDNQDPRYVKLRITEEFRCEFRQFKYVEFLNHAYMFDSIVFIPSEKEVIQQDFMINRTLRRPLIKDYNNTQDMFTREIHGPAYKEYKSGFMPHERDYAILFAYPDAWPEKAMEWLNRPAIARPNNWPPPNLIQEIFESGCHIAAVGRGKRNRDPMDRKNYIRNLEGAVADTNAEIGMDKTE